MRLIRIIIAKIVNLVHRLRWSPIGYCKDCRRRFYIPHADHYMTCAAYKRKVFGGGK
jgi:hypothetical protein